METVTFPSRPQVAPHPEPPSHADPNAGGQEFREVFDLLQPESPASDSPAPTDGPSPRTRTEDAADPEPRGQAPDGLQDCKPDRIESPSAIIGQELLRPAPPQGQVTSAETLSAPEPEQKQDILMSCGGPVGQATAILQAPVAIDNADSMISPKDADAAYVQEVIATPTGGSPAPSTAVRQPVPEGSATSPDVDNAPLSAAPADEAHEQTGLFVLSRQPGTTGGKLSVALGVPAFWAAREAAEADSVVAYGLDPSRQMTATKDVSVPRATGMLHGEGATMPLEADPVSRVGDEEGTMQRDAKALPILASLQTIVVGPSQATPAPTMPQAAVPTTVPPQIPAQIAAALAARPERPLEVRLAPMELGGLTVNLRQDGEILRVIVHADRPDTLDLLRRNGDILLEELRLAGFSGAALSFADGGSTQDRKEAAQTRPVPITELPIPVPPVTTQTSGLVQTAPGLDLRL